MHQKHRNNVILPTVSDRDHTVPVCGTPLMAPDHSPKLLPDEGSTRWTIAWSVPAGHVFRAGAGRTDVSELPPRGTLQRRGGPPDHD